MQMRATTKVEAKEAQVNVVILAGGFNEGLVQEILKKLAEDTLGKDSSSSLLRKTVVRRPHFLFSYYAVGSLSTDTEQPCRKVL